MYKNQKINKLENDKHNSFPYDCPKYMINKQADITNRNA